MQGESPAGPAERAAKNDADGRYSIMQRLFLAESEF